MTHRTRFQAIHLPAYCFLIAIPTGLCAARPLVSFDMKVMETGLGFARGVYAIADIDGDGVNDIICGGTNPRLYWVRAANLETKRKIAASAKLGYEIHAADMDRDGDIDVVSSGSGITWWENPGKGRGRWIEHAWGSYGSNHNGGSHDFKIGDINGDGRIDAVERMQNSAEYMLYIRTVAGAWKTHIVKASRKGEGAFLGDIDRDGDLDLTDGWAWFECPGSPGTGTCDPGGTWTAHAVGDATHHLTRAWIADINGDGRVDIVSSPTEFGGSALNWYEAPADPAGRGWKTHTIVSYQDPNFHTLQVGDIDRDGRLDILVGSTHGPNAAPKLLWIFFNDGDGLRWREQKMTSPTGIWQGVLGDVGSDGDLDILSADYRDGQAEFYENVAKAPPAAGGGMSMSEWTYVNLDGSRTDGGTFGLDTADVTGDGFPDLVTGAFFYRNPGVNWDTAPWPRIALPHRDALLFVDIDGDERADVFAVDPSGCHWFEARDRSCSSWSARKISTLAVNDHGFSTQGYAAAQIVPGGRKEIVISTHTAGIVCFAIPSRPDRSAWPHTVIHPSYSEGIAIADIDNDGDNDVCGGSSGKVFWFENAGTGDASRWNPHEIGSLSAELDRVAVADINGDGNLDIAVTEEKGKARCIIFEHPGNASAKKWPSHEIARASYGFLSMHIADFDHDGDPEIVAAASSGDCRMHIWEHQGGWNFTSHIVDGTAGRQSHIGCLPVDLDRDGDLDLVSPSWTRRTSLHAWRNDAGRVNGPSNPTVAAPPHRHPAVRRKETVRPEGTGRYGNILGRYMHNARGVYIRVQPGGARRIEVQKK